MEYEKSIIEIGKKIKNRRKELKMSQEEFAKLIGYDGRSVISKIENGKIDLTVDKIKLISKVLNISLHYLVGVEENNTIDKYDLSHLSASQLQELNEFITFNKGMFMAKGKTLSEHDEETLKEALIEIFLETENK